jgi:hypothetical protein
VKFLILHALLFAFASTLAFGQGIYKGGPGGGFASTEPITVVSSVPEFVAIYPNPTGGTAATLNLFSKHSPIASFQIIDSYGKDVLLIRNLPPQSNRFMVAVGRLATGLYFANIRLANGKIYLQKLVHQ